jgi:hypothetical protein
MTSLVIVLGFGVAAFVGVAAALPRLRGTTLVAPACWALLAIASVAAVEAALAARPGSAAPSASIYRCLAGAVSFCPLLALLGAKRPQDRAWGWIVLSLWVVLALPALEAWLFQLGRFELHPARAWFLLILIVMGAGNHLATRYAASACLVSLGQVLLMKESLPPGLAGPAWPRTAIAMFAAAVLAGWLVPTRSRTVADRAWLDFRDAFGLVWGLRVQERVNGLAAAQTWPIRLTWRGFVPLEGGSERGQDDARVARRQARDILYRALWRFVSPAWLDARGEGDEK